MFKLNLSRQNKRAAESGRPKLKPNVNKEWIDKYRRAVAEFIDEESKRLVREPPTSC